MTFLRSINQALLIRPRATKARQETTIDILVDLMVNKFDHYQFIYGTLRNLIFHFTIFY